MYLSLKLSLSCLLCFCGIRAHFIPQSQNFKPLTFDSSAYPSENNVSFRRLYPKKSNNKRHSDVSDNLVPLNEGSTSDMFKGVNFNRNQKDDRRNKSSGGIIINDNGRQIELKGGLSVTTTAKPKSVKTRMRREARTQQKLSGKSTLASTLLASVHINPYLALHIRELFGGKSSKRTRRSTDSYVAASYFSPDDGKRAYKSGVADRIAHGFGKRTSFDPKDVPYMYFGETFPDSGFGRFRDETRASGSQNIMNASLFKRARDLLSLRPGELDSKVTQVMSLLAELLLEPKSTNERFESDSSEQQEGYASINRKPQDIGYDTPERYFDATYDRVYR